ncbi:2-aminoethylphosphonate aminotransferase [Arenibacter sp. F20364]|uniref:2-aminoethylphosphonate aminotransferase n=1 Tax=Arenibacter sp. F20364 TaxID=2926415 RepID=UPI001FF31B19|nr:2-aminoethylphosphonate--pyruvate transaminase [Arenibacter sp. F20364]MCK0190038.1 2-aminoethylphosphonate--pyruvate transaminase [Arenibacter sp. F20364]
MQIKRNVLLNPGPATTTDTVKLAQAVTDICPREKEFGDLMEYCATEITKFVGDPKEYATVFFGGSGTATVEAILSSVVPEDGRILIIDNGAYGKRMCQITKIYKIDTVVFESSSIEPIDLKALEEVIKAEKGLTHLAVIHHETTTGLLNDITAVGELCSTYNISFIVDSMSGFAAIPVDMKAMNIDYLAASSNKNIQGMAGIGFAICNKKALIATEAIPMRNLYLNLYAQYAYFEKTHQTRFTPPVQTFYALKQAIIETKEETIEKRYARYSKSWETLLEGISEMGLEYLIDREYHSKIITSIIEPKSDQYDFEEMHDFFFERGFTIYPGKVNNYDTFRISNIGQIDYTDIQDFLKVLKEYLTKIGFLKV